MPQQYTLAQGSILIDVPPSYCQAFSKLSADQRELTGSFFSAAIHGGDDPGLEELFGDMHQSELRQIVPVNDGTNMAETADLATSANRILNAYNSRQADFGITFDPIPAGSNPTCYRWIYDPELDEWVLVINYGLTVATGNVSGAQFNWLPLSAAKGQPGFALPEELDYLMDGSEVVVDLKYHLTLTFLAQ
ncbi:hypothetical protein [Engelhardtia mirabilis]|uniref:Uncharacterized protein n=1 Tax=Engelhardtia mirabilis TaxID=2528011 RepID=A0A518BF32_9BACT|nr:hypothetical protein Pla133_06620 [Planctomycetes bacterium Pla133]QDU99922.1 hypothetical protein Pla86_06610 [Planctomycetes bacterium Pla86]